MRESDLRKIHRNLGIFFVLRERIFLLHEINQ